jgi:hypothetical protein
VVRGETDKAKLQRFLVALGARVTGPGSVFLVGGGTALLLGWRDMTIDVDLKASPEPPGFFEAIAALKDELDVNVELASPDDFIPEVPGWRERCLFIARHGQIDFFHYDPVSQALAKIERGHTRDLEDVAAMLERKMVTCDQLLEAYRLIEPALIRFPAIDPTTFREGVLAVCQPADDV